MTEPEARRVFANLMQKARKGRLSEHERLKLSIARQKLRRAKRPVTNKRNPIDRGEYFWIVRTTTFPARYLTREGLSPHHIHAHHFSSYEAARKMGQKFFKGTKTLWQIEQRDDEWARPITPGKPRANRNPSGGNLQRIGRAVEVRYHRTIGRSPGYYKHEIRSRSAGVYTIPPGWVYVGSKSILITEKPPRVR